MLHHKGTKTIETKRLTLRPFQVEDAEAMYRNWANDERVTRYLTWTPHPSAEASKGLLELWCREYEDPAKYNWAIEYQGEPIGNISVVRMLEERASGELGYCMGHAFWGQGIMTEAVKAVCRYLMEEIGFEALQIRHDMRNPASGKVAAKCGFAFMGEDRIADNRHPGEMIDVKRYSLRKD